ncbi:hypothetical protein ACGF0D_39415 [Kitasatospora sp. NPDC048298]|uniref:hypothetical protein n=1 Tax=Kitasatospora sp. NPDC048298 TaxID=3364049 RepID=UPI00371EC40B
MKVLGIAVSSSALHYGALQHISGISLVPGAPERLGPADGLTGCERTADTYRRIYQDIHVLAPDIVVLVATRKHNNWLYRQAADRATLVTLVQLACHEDGIRCEEWNTEKIGKLIGAPAPSLHDVPLETIGAADRPKYWKLGRGDAFAAALAALHESEADNNR